MSPTAAPFSHPIEVHKVPSGGTEMTLRANERERKALAEALDLVAVHFLTAELALKPWRKAGLRVTGTVTAEIEQTCIVTLEPVVQAIAEEVEVNFLPETQIDVPGREIDIDPDDDTPEPFSGTSVDLGAIVTEYLSLGIDPYPRKPGVVFEPVEDDADEEAEDTDSPFAALRGLSGRGPAKPDDN